MGTDRGRSGRADVCFTPAALKVSRFERVRLWCVEAERALALTFGDDLAVIRKHVDAGVFELWQIDDGRSWMVTRIDGDALTVCCYQGRDLSQDAEPVIEAARRLGLREIGFLTKDRALGRLMRRHGFAAAETVYRMTL